MPDKKDRTAHVQRLTMYTGIGVLAVVLILVAVSLFIDRDSPTSPADQEDVGNFEEYLETRPSLGDPNAPITLVEFADFKCPACKAFHELAFYNLREDFIGLGKMRLVFMNFPIPLGEDSYTAAVAGECLFRQDERAFWAYYDAMYTYQGPESQRWATLSRLQEIVRDYVDPIFDIDEEDFAQCVEEERYRDVVERDRQLGRNLGVRGTPTLFLNGEKLDRWGPYSSLKARIERELEEVEPAAQ